MLFSRTGYLSHRHPFHGLGQELTPPEVPTVPTINPEEPVAPIVPENASAGQLVRDALVSGLLSGVVTYAVSRSVSVEKPKALRVGFIMGGFTSVGQLLGSWLRTKIEAFKTEPTV